MELRSGLERTRPLTVGLAVLLDLLLGEPPNRWHPVAWLGGLVGTLERRAPRRARWRRLTYGVGLTVLTVGVSAAAGRVIEVWLARLPTVPRVVLGALALKSSFSLRELGRAAHTIQGLLDRGDIAAARVGLRALVSRPAGQLTAPQIASAAIESIAENLPDSVLAPLFAYTCAGLPGAFGYRAANVLDAMIGYHGEYEELGKVPARLDDLLNLAPARLSAVLLVGAAWLGRGDAAAATRILCRDHARTESPNAGWPMSACAGALRRRLAKPGHYELGGEFADPSSGDIGRAVRLYGVAAALGIVALMALAGRSNALRARYGQLLRSIPQHRAVHRE